MDFLERQSYVAWIRDVQQRVKESQQQETNAQEWRKEYKRE